MKVEKEGKRFTKPKFTIMIEGQKDSEAGEVDKGGEGLTQEERAKKKERLGIQK